MAIARSIALDTGVTAGHWELTHASEDFLAGIIDCTVHGWLDAAARAAGHEPLAARRFRVTVAELASEGVDLEITALLEPLLAGRLTA
jgi:hypothetical protein